MKKILFHLNCLEQGGAERVVTNLANRFAKENYEVLVATQWQGENEFTLDEGVQRIHVGLQKQDENKSRLKKILLRIQYLRELVEREQPDVVIAFAHNAIFRTLFSVRKNKIPTVIAVRINPVGNYDGPVDKLLIPWLFKRADGSVFQTEEQRDFFPDFIRQNSIVILNPIHNKYINAPQAKEKTKTVVHSSRIVDFKNQALLIKAFIKVHEKHPEYDLRIYGGDAFDGTMEILVKLIADNKAEDYVKIMGATDSLELELPKGELFVSSSDYEGLPNALMEAMALGLPVVATDCPPGSSRAIITDGENGLLVPVGDVEALADGINRLIENPELAKKLGKNALLIKNRANVEVIFEQWKKYLESVITSKTGNNK